MRKSHSAVLASLLVVIAQGTFRPTHSVADEPLGTITGRFLCDGQPPVPKDLYPHLSSLEADTNLARDSDRRVSGVALTYLSFLQRKIRPKTEDASLLVGKDGGIANVVIWIESQDISWTPPAEQTPVTIRLQGGNYAPRVTIVTVGQPLLVENADPIVFNFHTMFVNNPIANELLPAAPAPPTRLELPASEKLPMPYRSDQGPWANGLIFVRKNSFVAISAEDGRFSIPSVPPGEWKFRVWHERCGWVQHWPRGAFQYTVKSGANDLGDIKLQPALFAEKPLAP